ncbi:MAG: TonB-dependent receptor [Rhodoferax sp.]|nr:MAG: TonB-dependent receptor [Rhodoferax sp.]
MSASLSPARPGVFFLLACFLSASVLAQDTTRSRTLSDVVVTANRVEQPLSDLVSDVSIMDRAEIERTGAKAMAEILVRLPGFEYARNGGPGSTTSVYVRGAETRFLAVYVDGVRVDSQSTGGAAWEAIPASQIERIEVLRGPAAAVYGSDALGGVVQIFTRQGEGAAAPYVSMGAGTYGTTRVEAGIAGSGERLDYALNLANEYSRGFDALAPSTKNGDDDGYRLDSFSARLGWQLTPAHRLELNALASDLNSGYDTSNKDDRNLRKLQTGGLRWVAHWDDRYSTTVGWTNSQDRYETTPAVYLTKTDLSAYLWQNEWRSGGHLYTLIAERREDALNNASTTPRDTGHFQNSLAAGYGWKGGAHSVQLNVRHDADSVFGPVSTGSVGYGLALAPQWRVTASLATAFRAPTLFQRFSKYGSADMQAETSRNQEFGVHYASGPNSWDATVYQNDVSNLITFVANTGTCPGNTGGGASSGCYGNTSKARYRGLTLAARHVFEGNVALRGSLDLSDPRDASDTGANAGKLLARRATHHGVLGLDVPAMGWQWSADVQAYSHRYNDAANATYMPGYVLVGIAAEKRVAKDWTLLARVDNLGNAQYQLADGYATAGRSLFVNLRWAP